MSVALLKQYMQDNNISQNKVSNQLGVSPAVVSQYLAGKYAGDVQSVDKKVTQLVERKQAKSQDIDSDFVATETANKIIKTCAMAHAMLDMCIVVGDAGLGKTKALKQYASTNHNVIMLETDGTFSAKVILHELCEQLGIEGVKGRANYLMMSAVVEKLKGRDILIIVDEAELLSYKSLELIRRIHDKAEIGVVLAGMPRLRANLRGNRGEFKQLYSRVGMQFDMPSQLPASDVAMLVHASLGTDVFDDKLNDVSRGNARRLNKLCRAVARVSKATGTLVDEALIDECAGLLVG